MILKSLKTETVKIHISGVFKQYYNAPHMP
jgi:hypothetical protein